jgi:hypothetical protein
MNQSIQNTNWNSNSWLQSNTLIFNDIAAKITKKSPEIWNDQGRTHALTDGQRHAIIRPVFRQAYKIIRPWSNSNLTCMILCCIHILN